VTSEGTKEATERILTEIQELKELNTKELGFSAAPSANDLYHWHVKLFGFGDASPLGQVLFTSFFKLFKIFIISF
jgi:hypothetical protein